MLGAVSSIAHDLPVLLLDRVWDAFLHAIHDRRVEMAVPALAPADPRTAGLSDGTARYQ